MIFNSKTQKENDDVVLEVKDVDKSFWIPDERINSFKGYFLQPWKLFKKQGRKFDALSDITFTVKKGEFVGIVGKNGSGKSTLLKLIAGIYAPNKGEIKIHGQLVPFLELGVGFNPELSARENIFLNGTILGMSKKFLRTKVQEILAFAEVEEFADTPIKNYSSGMAVRLAFAIAIQAKADIYLLDEVLAVGDAGFSRKSMGKISELINTGVTVLYVSHDLESVKNLADRVIWLKGGRIEQMGEPGEIVDDFITSLM
ncbi:ABC transporter ATP-binding protein [Candidatus Dojkabacteria bacterium]|nr:ABC transporter ATP-binding protein [Candidatus Dojkabacteria bacterium]